jgi:hypothetical protein
VFFADIQMLLIPPQNRHPERSASQIYRIVVVYGAKSKDPGDANEQMLFEVFRPQTMRAIKSHNL